MSRILNVPNIWNYSSVGCFLKNSWYFLVKSDLRIQLFYNHTQCKTHINCMTNHYPNNINIFNDEE